MIPDLHPEELLDKAANGTISQDERVMLDAHLRECLVCRFAQEATRDFARLPMPRLDVDRLVTNALMARASESFRPRSRHVSALVAAAVGLLAVGSFAAVGQWTGVLPRLLAHLSTPVAKDSKASPSSIPAPRARATTVVEPAPAAEPEPEPELEPSLPSTRKRQVKAVKVRRTSRGTSTATPSSRSSGLGVATASAEASRPAWARTSRVEPTAPVASPLEPPRRGASAAEVFAAANQARLAGDGPLAMARYREILASWPSTLEAQQTHATLGRMLLDQGNPSSALEQLEAYLDGGDGALREEVLSARALALMRLGRVDDEARAWQTLLDQYPGSIHAARAHSRLEALSASR